VQQGIAFLNLAWDAVFDLVLQLRNAEDWNGVDDPEIPDQYWAAAKYQLATALALAHQGTEFLIKAKIAEVSPFLLIASRPSEWPRGCTKTDIPFSRFRTLDAQDLLRVHNTVAPRLSDDFAERFDQLRVLRNTITHTIDKKLLVTVKQIVLAVLEAVSGLRAGDKWVQLRRSRLEADPDSVAFSPDGADYRLCREVGEALTLLSTSELRRFFAFDKKVRSYICPQCSYHRDLDESFVLRSAQLEPNRPSARKIFCFVCRDSHAVARKKCSHCKGNVLAKDWDMRCLSCGQWNV